MTKIKMLFAVAFTAIFVTGCVEPEPRPYNPPPRYTSAPPVPEYRNGPPPDYREAPPPREYREPPPPREYREPARDYRTGTVDHIEVIRQGDNNNIAGTIIGGIVGGLIGHQIGGGSGNTVATIAGAAGGAYAGTQVEGRQRAANESFRITVRYNDGAMERIVQNDVMDLRPGDRVRVENGRVLRY